MCEKRLSCPCGRPNCVIPWGAHDWSALASFDRDPLSANDPALTDEIDLIVAAALDAVATHDFIANWQPPTGQADE